MTAVPRLPFVANVVRVQLQWEDIDGNPLYNNLFVQYEGGPPSASEALTLAEAIFSAASDLTAQCVNSTTLIGCRVTDLSADDTGDALHEGSVAGSLTGVALPASTCVLLNFTIARRYRGGKPRNYFPMGDETKILNPRAWTTGFVTNVGESWSAFIAAVLGTVAGDTTLTAHVNVSYYSGSTGSIVDGGNRGKTTPTRRPTPLVNDILGFSVNPRICSQRRRLGRS